jgi:SAM-dependent methyltransferase
MTDIAARLLPRTARRSVMRWWRTLRQRPRVGAVDFGDLRRLQPISNEWGFDRGTPIDRFYIDRFLTAEASAVRGRVLEIGNADMTRRYGGDRVTRSDVLHAADAAPPVTIVGDLAQGQGIPSGAFDCAIITQTIQLIYDVHAVVRTLHRILAPGGVALVTVPGITRISRYDMDRWGQFWCFTTRSARQLFEEAFAPANIDVTAYGNVLAATAFLHGIAAEELDPDELSRPDPDFQTLIAVRAQKEP